MTDTLVDDQQVDTGFFLYNQAPVSMLSWRDANKGYAGHFWYAYTHSGPAPDSCYATWTPNLPQAGAYEVFVYIPYSNATAARYKVTTISGQYTVEIDQKAVRDSWVSLGTFDLPAGSAGMVRLGDASVADRQELVFDAVRWSYRGTATYAAGSGAELPGDFFLEQNYPNPFNPVTTLEYAVAGARDQGPEASQLSRPSDPTARGETRTPFRQTPPPRRRRSSREMGRRQS